MTFAFAVGANRAQDFLTRGGRDDVCLCRARTRSQLPRDAYTYSIPDDLAELVLPGVRVEIPFGKRSILGYVVERTEESAFAEVRAIDGVIDEPRLLLDHHIALARQIADRYCAPLGEVLRAMLPKGVRTRPSRRAGPRSMSRAVAEAGAAGPPEPPPILNEAQRAAVGAAARVNRGPQAPPRPAPRCDREREDRGVPRGHRCRPREGTRRDRPRARDRIDPADDSPFHRAISRAGLRWCTRPSPTRSERRSGGASGAASTAL